MVKKLVQFVFIVVVLTIVLGLVGSFFYEAPNPANTGKTADKKADTKGKDAAVKEVLPLGRPAGKAEDPPVLVHSLPVNESVKVSVARHVEFGVGVDGSVTIKNTGQPVYVIFTVPSPIPGPGGMWDVRNLTTGYTVSLSDRVEVLTRAEDQVTTFVVTKK